MSAIYDNVRHTLGLYIERCGWGVARAWLVFVNWSSDGTSVEDAVEGVVGITVAVIENWTLGVDGELGRVWGDIVERTVINRSVVSCWY